MNLKNEFTQRYNICSSCENLDKEKFKCNKCGCNLNIKIRVPFFHCPIMKW